MNLVGKIFTVLIFVMAVSFMILSITVFATHRNWHTEATDLQRSFQLERQVNQDLRAELERSRTQLQAEQVARRHALAGLQTRVQQFQEQLQQRERDLSEQQLLAGQRADALQQAEERLANLTQEVSELRDQVRDAINEREAAFSEVVTLTDQVNQYDQQLANMREHQAQLAQRVSRLRSVLTVHDLDEHMTLDGAPPFRVQGVVEDVRANLIEVSLGSDDGLRRGHTLEVFRGSSYLGRVEVVERHPDRAVAKILPEFREGEIRKGDRVATRIN